VVPRPGRTRLGDVEALLADAGRHEHVVLPLPEALRAPGVTTVEGSHEGV
jgi:hypothetical protein